MTLSTYADGARLIPTAPEAEESLAGWAVASFEWADRFVDDLTAEDFHDPRCWQVIHAAHNVPEALVDGDKEWADAARLGHGLVAHGCAARADAIIAATGLQWGWLCRLVDGRRPEVEPDMEAVVEVGVVRAANRILLDQLEANNVDVRWLTDCDAIADEARAAVLAVAEAVGRQMFEGGSEAEVADSCFRLGRLFAVDDAVLRDAFMRHATGQEERR
jgi:hypothetical protein